MTFVSGYCMIFNLLKLQQIYNSISCNTMVLSSTIIIVSKNDRVWPESNTTPDPGYQWEIDNVTIRHHKREQRGQPFPSRWQQGINKQSCMSICLIFGLDESPLTSKQERLLVELCIHIKGLHPLKIVQESTSYDKSSLYWFSKVFAVKISLNTGL